MELASGFGYVLGPPLGGLLYSVSPTNCYLSSGIEGIHRGGVDHDAVTCFHSNP